MTISNNEGFRYEDIIVGSVTDEIADNKPYKLVRDMAEQTWKIKSGRDGVLQGKWNLLKYGAALRLTIGKFKGWDYVEDIQSLTEMIAIESARKLQAAIRDLKNESIEASVAVKGIIDQLCNKVETPDDLIEAKDNWLRHALRNYSGVKTG